MVDLTKLPFGFPVAERLAARFVSVVAVLIVGTALVTVIVSSFRPKHTLPFEAGAWTLENFATAFGNATTYDLLFNTLLYAIASFGLGISIALAVAWLVERTDIPFPNAIYTLILVPLAVPSLLKALGWVLLIGPRQGILNLLLRDLLNLEVSLGPLDIYKFGGMVFLTGLAIVPTMIILLGPLFRQIDPTLEESAATAGVGTLVTLRRITVPLVSHGILALTIY